MALIKTKVIRPEFHEIDHRGKLKISSLYDYMRQLTEEHLYSGGIGSRVIHGAGFSRDLYTLTLELKKLPVLEDEIILETWEQGYSAFGTFRQYELTVNGEQAGGASSSWIMTDRPTGQVISPEDGSRLSRESLPETWASFPGCLYPVFDGPLFSRDLLSWIDGAFSWEFWEAHVIRRLEFLCVKKPGGRVVVRKSDEIDQSYFLEGHDQKTGHLLFRARGCFPKVESLKQPA